MKMALPKKSNHVREVKVMEDLYVNGTPEELVKYLFWFGRR